MSGFVVFSLRHSSLPEFEMPLEIARTANLNNLFRVSGDPSGSGPRKRLD